MTGSFSVISVIFHIVIQLFKRHIEQIPGSQERGGAAILFCRKIYNNLNVCAKLKENMLASYLLACLVIILPI